MIDAAFMNELVAIEKRLIELARQADRAGCSLGPGWLRDAESYIAKGRQKIWKEVQDPYKPSRS